MPISEQKAKAAIAEAMTQNSPGSVIRDTAMSAGADEGTSVPADTVAEVATIQVGADGSGNLTDALAVMVGAPADKFKSLVGSKATVDFQNGTPADVPEGTLWRVSKRKRQSRGGKDVTNWKDEDEYSETAKENREDLTPTNPAVKEDEVLQILAYHPTTAFTINLANSTIALPAIIGTDA